MDYVSQIECHYERQWRVAPERRTWESGPRKGLPEEFCVLEYSPRAERGMWTYATCCMSQATDEQPLELHLFSPVQSDLHVELLTVISQYHRNGESLGLGHIVNFGRPWLGESRCGFGLTSLPYLDGPGLEWLAIATGNVRFLWLVPITAAERVYAKTHGIEALELKFEETQFNYLDPNRTSVVADVVL